MDKILAILITLLLYARGNFTLLKLFHLDILVLSIIISFVLIIFYIRFKINKITIFSILSFFYFLSELFHSRINIAASLLIAILIIGLINWNIKTIYYFKKYYVFSAFILAFLQIMGYFFLLIFPGYRIYFSQSPVLLLHKINSQFLGNLFFGGYYLFEDNSLPRMFSFMTEPSALVSLFVPALIFSTERKFHKIFPSVIIIFLVLSMSRSALIIILLALITHQLPKMKIIFPILFSALIMYFILSDYSSLENIVTFVDNNVQKTSISSRYLLTNEELQNFNYFGNTSKDFISSGLIFQPAMGIFSIFPIGICLIIMVYYSKKKSFRSNLIFWLYFEIIFIQSYCFITYNFILISYLFFLEERKKNKFIKSNNYTNEYSNLTIKI